MVLIKQRGPHPWVQGGFEIQCGGAVEPANRHSLAELPGAVRPHLRLLGFVERDVEQRGPAIPDVEAGAFQKFSRQRREEAGTLRRERGIRRRGGPGGGWL